MPIELDEHVEALLAEGRITAVTLDTNIFDEKKLSLNSSVLNTFKSLKEIPFQFLLSSTVLREVQGHLEKSMTDALGAVKKATGTALFAFDTIKPTRDELISLITGGISPTDSASARLSAFVKDTGCEVLDDSSLVDVATLFKAYFEARPPFSRAKKSEFPDALALHALDREAAKRQTGFLVVSKDRDWRAFCEKSPQLYLVPEVEKALSLISNVPVQLRSAIVEWFSESHDGRNEVQSAVSSLIEGMDVEANAYASSGYVETDARSPEVRSIEWPHELDIDIINTEELEENSYRLIVSLPLVVTVIMNIDLSFSVWDSIDKESVGLGERTIEVERNEEIRVNITIDLHSVGNSNKSIELMDTEVDISSLEVDLGEVDAFEENDFSFK